MKGKKINTCVQTFNPLSGNTVHPIFLIHLQSTACRCIKIRLNLRRHQEEKNNKELKQIEVVAVSFLCSDPEALKGGKKFETS